MTEKKPRPRSMADSEANLRAIVEGLRDAAFVTDATGLITYLSPAARTLFRCEPEEMVGTFFPSHLPDFEVERAMSAFLKSVATGEDVIGLELSMKRRDETLFQGELSASFPRRDGRIVGSVGTIRDVSDRRPAGRPTDEEAALTKAFFANLPYTAYAIDETGRYVRWNRNANRIFGWSDEEMAAANAAEQVSAADRSYALAMIQEVFRTGEGAAEFRLLTKEGREIPFHCTGARVEVDGKRYLVGMGVDLTERHALRAALQASEQQYREIFDATNDAFIIQDERGRIVDVNERACAQFGYDRETMLGLSIDGLSLGEAPYSQAESEAAVARAVREGPQVFEWRCKRCNGELFWAEVALRASRIGGAMRVIAAVRDITERKRLEAAQLESTARIRQIVSNAPIVLYSFDADGVFTLSEGKALAAMGVKPGQIVGQSLFDVYRGRENHLANLRRALAGEEFVSRAVETDCVYEAHHTPLFSADGKYAGTVGVLIDITKRVRAEEEKAKLEAHLQQAMKMEAIGRLAGGVAHDFNNLLTGIRGNIDLVLMDLAPGDALYPTLREVAAAADSTASLVRQLLAFSRQQLIEPKVIDLNELIANLHKMLVRLIGEDVALETVQCAGLGAVKIDPGQFEQVLVNLAVNARDAMPNGGRLVIETANVVLDEQYCARHEQATPGPNILLAVSDTGCGMTEEVKSRLFEPFFTTKPRGRGTGLGLATTFGAVKQAGGAIEVYSEVGKGTSFKILLPRVAEPAEHLTRVEPTPDLPGGAETILLVEDEPIVRDLALRVLRRLGYHTLPAANGPEALLLAEAYPGRIDLLMTDVVMPGMNGRELAGRLAGRHAETKVLYTSGYTANVVAHHGVIEERLNFIGKPYTPQSLARKLREVLDDARGSTGDSPSGRPPAPRIA